MGQESPRDGRRRADDIDAQIRPAVTVGVESAAALGVSPPTLSSPGTMVSVPFEPLIVAMSTALLAQP